MWHAVRVEEAPPHRKAGHSREDTHRLCSPLPPCQRPNSGGFPKAAKQVFSYLASCASFALAGKPGLEASTHTTASSELIRTLGRWLCVVHVSHT